MTFRLIVALLFLIVQTYWIDITANDVFRSNRIGKICLKVSRIRGGASKRQSLLDEKYTEEEKKDYYESFQLDYGKKDDSRKPGFLRGFIKTGSLSSLPEKDAFLKWMYEYMENGDKNIKGRIKPFYGADFGTRKDLKKGENPKIIIVQRKLAVDESGRLQEPSDEVDVEVREIWQPWLKLKCNFVVRYIVPNRQNIIRILAQNNQFHANLKYEDDEKGKRTSWIEMKFSPTWLDKLKGKKDILVKHYVDAKKLFPKKK